MNRDYKRFLEENPDRVRGDGGDGAMFSGLLKQLRAMPEPEPRSDFAARVLERVKREEAERAAAVAAARRYRPLRWALRAAAAVAVAALGFAGLRAVVRPAADPGAVAMARAAAACEVIVSGQGADGGWHADGAAVAGGNSARAGQDGALSAIALMALMRSGTDPLGGPHADAVRSGMENLIAVQSNPQGLGDGATRLGRSSRYLVAMALRAGAALPGAPAEWREAAGRAAVAVPVDADTVRLNRQLAHAGSMPEPWKKAGGPVLTAALELLEPRTL
jgi:hypothetical protein